MRDSPYDRFEPFIAPGADRFVLLRDLLAERGLPFSVIPLAGNRHFFTGPALPGQGGEHPALRGRTVLAAHYDRAAGSPGANDNSAAVFMLVETAVKLRAAENRNWLIIFTDKEELSGNEGIRDQGSYLLAAGLKKLGLRELFIFDACGAGDTLIISTAADRLIKDETGPGIARVRRQVRNLRSRALETVRHLSMEKVLLLPTPFSDDAGLLRAGLPAQTITVLPAKEAAGFAALLRKDPGLAAALLSREVRDSRGGPNRIPETWRCLNGPGDSPLRLTPQHFKGVVRFASALCGN